MPCRIVTPDGRAFLASEWAAQAAVVEFDNEIEGVGMNGVGMNGVGMNGVAVLADMACIQRFHVMVRSSKAVHVLRPRRTTIRVIHVQL